MTRRGPRRDRDGLSARDTQFGSALDRGLRLASRNPIPLLLFAAGAGWFLHSMGRAKVRRDTGEEIPVLNTGQARIYDPDVSPRHPMHDTLESRREMSARI